MFYFTSVLWLSMVTSQVAQPTPLPENGKSFLQADQLTHIQPLRLRFHKGETQLTEKNQEIILLWARKILNYDVPVFITSYASAPTGIRDLTKDIAHHEAIRLAFNRGLLTKNLLEQSGISKKRLILKALGQDPLQIEDTIILTIRNGFHIQN